LPRTGTSLRCSCDVDLYSVGDVAGLGHALGTASPVRDLGFVDLEALVVGRGETGGGADRAVDVDDAAQLRQIR
jgi:hypothetical protein